MWEMALRQAVGPLCGDCYREELEAEPWDALVMRPIRHGRRR